MIMFPGSRAKGAVNAGAGSAHSYRHPAGRLRCARRRNIPGRKVRLYRCVFEPPACGVWPLIRLRWTWSSGSHQTVTQDHDTRAS